MTPIARREFLRVTAGAGALAAGVKADAQAPRSSPISISSAAYPRAGDYAIQALRAPRVTIADRFWQPRITTNASITIPLLVQRQTESRFNGNVLEAAMLSLEARPDARLQAIVDRRVAELRAQAPAGNGGFEVASTYFLTTGRRDLIEQAVTAAEALHRDFTTRNPPFSGGERDAVNCLQLYRVTRDKKHLDLAKHYLDIRGREDSINRSRHNQSYLPVLEQREAVGHAVNCVTLAVSLLDVGVLTGLTEYADAANRIWLDIVSRKMYVTGGVGSTGNEGFGEPYSLPNISAYAETCAVLMFATLNHKLFLATGDAKYIDVLERGLYNNALSGVSLQGDRFFYVNRLASAGDGRDTRWERASLECCPPNLVRFLASMPAYVYAQDATGSVYVNLYVSGGARFTIGPSTSLRASPSAPLGAGVRQLAIAVDSEMPWGGTSKLTISTTEPVRSAIKLRVPGWARGVPAPGGLYSYVGGETRPARVAVNGTSVGAVPDTLGYVTIDRTWRDGDVIEAQFPFSIRTVVADARVKETRNRIAIERGPLVYCAEGPEVKDGKALGLMIDPGADLRVEADAGLFGGTTVIRATAASLTDPSLTPAPIALLPYPSWANRGPGEMTVWLSTTLLAPGDIGPSGGWIFYVNPNAAADGWRYLEAAPVDQSQGAKWGCFRTPLTGARGAGVGEGRKNTAEMVAACAERGTAADLCANYVLNGVGGWFLPSTGELALMYRNLKASGAADFRDQAMADNCQYWTSTQQTADMADHIDFADNGRLHYDDKDFPRRVRAIRAW